MVTDFALSMQSVTIAVPGGPVIADLSLAVERGSFHGLLGFGSCGKTAVSEVAAGLRKHSAGEVRVLGADPMDRRSDVLRRVGYQSQRALFFPYMTVAEQLTTIASLHNVPLRKVNLLQEALRLDHLTDVRVEQLELRDNRLLAIACAAIGSPELLILDEPTSGLEAADRLYVVSVLRASNIVGMTALYVTRNLDELERLCDAVTILDDCTDALGSLTDPAEREFANFISRRRAALNGEH